MYRCYLFFLIVLSSCVEPFEATTEEFESALVIDALITNELKYQTISLTRTYRFEEEPEGETNAIVSISGDDGEEYNFNESSPGIYVSSIMFNAKPNVNYELSITTSAGSSYVSKPTLLTKSLAMDDLYASVVTNDQNVEGVSIMVDTFDPQGESLYYRFDYEETYKIVAPNWNPQDLYIVSETPPILGFEIRPREEEVCYNTVNSIKIILANTSGFIEDRLSGFQVRFIGRDDYIIGHRYSILVKQYVISREAHAFYKTLSELSGLESIFSENQPGFFNGNIVAQNDPREKVIGFFDVSAVNQERIFFNHQDFFPDDLIPAYPNDCFVTNPVISEVINGVRFNNIKFFGVPGPDEPRDGPYKVVPRVCGDCTVLGDSEIPDFWIE
nr:DUF4249 domain-containing protein [uncultured Allomuricauda sp.]